MSKTSSLITINGFAVPKIGSYSLEMQDLDSENSGRSESGQLHREVIRKNVATVSLSCTLDQDQLDTISAAIDVDIFPVSFRAPVSGGYKTCNMYAGNRSAELLTNTPQELWKFGVNLIEY